MNCKTLPIMLALTLLLPVAQAAAQAAGSSATNATASTTTSTWAYDKLSPGNQKIASAIFEAQVTSTGTGSSSTTSKTLTLDQVAQRKADGRGWGEIYKQLKEQGLVTYKNLGLAVSAYNRSHHPQSANGLVTTASGRTMRQNGGGYDAYERRGGDDVSANPAAGRGGTGGNGNGYGRAK